MLKKSIKFKDYDGNDREEEFYFNLSRAELAEMELSKNGGLTKILERIVAAKDTEKLSAIFKDLILKSYGEKSNDGKHFRKSEVISTDFSHTEAYVELYMTLIKDEEEATAFIKGIIPKDLSNAINNNTQN